MPSTGKVPLPGAFWGVCEDLCDPSRLSGVPASRESSCLRDILSELEPHGWKEPEIQGDLRQMPTRHFNHVQPGTSLCLYPVFVPLTLPSGMLSNLFLSPVPGPGRVTVCQRSVRNSGGMDASSHFTVITVLRSGFRHSQLQERTLWPCGWRASCSGFLSREEKGAPGLLHSQCMLHLGL